MGKKKKSKAVLIREGIVNKVAENKVKTGMPIATFFEKAAEEKLAAEEKPQQQN